MLVTPAIFQACAGTKYIQAPIEDSQLVIPLSAFEVVKKTALEYRKYIVAQNDTLQFPICVYRLSSESYRALWMKCTHQGTELHVFGDRLQCPAHGSEFTTTGAVQQGPADESLRTFAVVVASNELKINLS